MYLPHLPCVDDTLILRTQR